MIDNNGGGEIELFVGPREGKKRLVLSTREGTEVHRDEVTTNSARDRDRWLRSVAGQLQVDPSSIAYFVDQLLAKSDEADRQTANNRASSRQQMTQADRLVQLAEDMEFFHDSANKGYASFDRSGHRETWPIRDRMFKQFLGSRFYSSEGRAPGGDAIQNAIATLESKAIFDGNETEVFLRYAEADNAFFVDLCNSSWQVVQITTDGWAILDDSPVKFRRTNGMLALPLPQKGGTLQDLHRVLNIPTEDMPLLDGWLINAAKPSGPYCILLLVGEQGTAKSTVTRILRALIDPNKAPLRAEPRDERDMLISASNGWILAYDNLSYLKPGLSDALCRMATGSGFATRQLYTDDGEVLFAAQRPITMNSIEDLATKSDLLDRAIILTLDQIPETERRTEADYWQEFEHARPLILGALYDALSTAMRNLPHVNVERLPRMADFAKFAIAAEPAMQVPAGTFMERFSQNRISANEIALESTPVASAVFRLISNCHGGQWRGTATQLLDALSRLVPEPVLRQQTWPKSPKGLGSILRRISPNLRQNDVNVEFTHSGHRLISITRQADTCVQTTPGNQPPQGPPTTDDGMAGQTPPRPPAPTCTNGVLDAVDALDASLRNQSGSHRNTDQDSEAWEAVV